MPVPPRTATALGALGEDLPGLLADERTCEEKVCGSCGVKKPLDAFYIQKSRRRHRSTCKDCDLAKNKAWHQANREHRSVYHRERSLAKFGLTESEYEALLVEQGGGCAICGEAVRDRANHRRGPKALAVDHNHETGLVRGILCSNCNTLLGLAKDDPERLRAAAAYLEDRS